MTFSFLFPALRSEEDNLPKGAKYFLYPNFEFCQIANFFTEEEVSYFDERVAKIPEEKLGLYVFIYTPLNISFQRVREIGERLEKKGKKVLLFGPLISKRPDLAGNFPYIKGSLLNILPEIKRDLAKGELKKEYIANRFPNYLLPRFDLNLSSVNRIHQMSSFVLGCLCPKDLREFCPYGIYYGEEIKRRDKEEIVGEILTRPYKRVNLLDDDIAFDFDYYFKTFSLLWQFKKEWIVNASAQILKSPQYLRFLSKVGVRVLYLREDFLGSDEVYSLNRSLAKEKRKGVKRIQSERILVGLKIALFLREGVDYEEIFQNLKLIDPDFLEIRFFRKGREVSQENLIYHPLIKREEPLWLKASFYSFRSILSRLFKRPRRVGLYTTFFYSLPINLAYRQNFLEGISYPP